MHKWRPARSWRSVCGWPGSAGGTFVEALGQKRALVKTVGPRATLHVLPAEEVPFWMAANRLHFESEKRRWRRSGVDMDRFVEVVAAMLDTVGPTPIGRAELEAELERRVPALGGRQEPGLGR